MRPFAPVHFLFTLLFVFALVLCAHAAPLADLSYLARDDSTPTTTDVAAAATSEPPAIPIGGTGVSMSGAPNIGGFLSGMFQNFGSAFKFP